MATPTQLRSAVARLSGLAERDVRSLFSGNPVPDRLRAALEDVLPLLIDQYGTAAAALAAEWYDDLRLESGVGGAFQADPSVVRVSTGDSLAAWALGPLYGGSGVDAALVLLAGGLQRRIANAARDTVMRNSVADPNARGWQRVGFGECAFCAMLIGRGAVYSEAGADFASHDYCNCGAIPTFDGRPKPVKPYIPSGRNITDADRSRVREYLRTH